LPVLERPVFISINQRKQPAWRIKYAKWKYVAVLGVLVKIDGEWKIKHYVLSMTVPEWNVNAVIKIKAPIEEQLISGYNKASR
jgi:hypothetical protein